LEPKFEDENTFWIELFDSTKKGKPEMNGKVRLRIDMLLKEDADEDPLGKGRTEPNKDPFLPPPEGRIEFSMNPWKMLKRLVSPKFLKKMQKCFCCLICLAITIFLLPDLIDNIFGNIISNLF
jgi:hypothetical protein|tara:strand:+ start:115 stop:483 length:369 start_codon:yes stop_codon:yes gene_type:complete